MMFTNIKYDFEIVKAHYTMFDRNESIEVYLHPVESEGLTLKEYAHAVVTKFLNTQLRTDKGVIDTLLVQFRAKECNPVGFGGVSVTEQGGSAISFGDGGQVQLYICDGLIDDVYYYHPDDGFSPVPSGIPFYFPEEPEEDLEEDIRSYNIGASNYAEHKIQPWDIYLEYDLNPWDADIVKRVLRTKETDGRRLDYEKIIHICKERIRQIDEYGK